MKAEQIKQKIVALSAEIGAEEEHAMKHNLAYRGQPHEQWFEGVRDAKQADHFKLLRLLDEIDRIEAEAS